VSFAYRWSVLKKSQTVIFLVKKKKNKTGERGFNVERTNRFFSRYKAATAG